MKLTLKKKHILFVFLVVGFLFLGIFLTRTYRSTDGYYPILVSESDKPYLVEGHDVYENILTNNYFQPVIVDYKWQDGGFYMIGQYVDSSGNVLEKPIFLYGKKGSLDRENFVLKWRMLEPYEILIEDQIRDRFPIGKQVSVGYVGNWLPDKAIQELLDATDDKYLIYNLPAATYSTNKEIDGTISGEIIGSILTFELKTY